MNTSNAYLVYGYQLPAPDFGFDEPPVWAEEMPLSIAALDTLLAAQGFHDTPDSPDYLRRRWAAEAAYGIKIVPYGYTDDGTDNYLLGFAQETGAATAKEITLTLPADADERLATALNILGVPAQAGPGWFLASYYG